MEIKTLYVMLYDKFEILDVFGPIEFITLINNLDNEINSYPKYIIKTVGKRDNNYHYNK